MLTLLECERTNDENVLARRDATGRKIDIDLMLNMNMNMNMNKQALW